MDLDRCPEEGAGGRQGHEKRPHRCPKAPGPEIAGEKPGKGHADRHRGGAHQPRGLDRILWSHNPGDRGEQAAGWQVEKVIREPIPRAKKVARPAPVPEHAILEESAVKKRP